STLVTGSAPGQFQKPRSEPHGRRVPGLVSRNEDTGVFEQALLTNGPQGNRRWGTVAGVIGQSCLITGAVLVPMIFPEVMPRLQGGVSFPAPPPPLPPSPDVSAVRPRSMPSPLQPEKFYPPMPERIPERAAELIDPDPASIGPASGYIGP